MACASPAASLRVPSHPRPPPAPQMLQGMCLEGLQDLLMQYFEMRVSFTSRDQALLFIVLGTCGILSQMALLPALMRVATGVWC